MPEPQDVMPPPPPPPEPRDMSYPSRYDSVSNHTSVTGVYKDLNSLVHQKNLRAAGAPSFKGRASRQPCGPAARATIPSLNPEIDPSYNCRLPPSGERHPEWSGSISDKWMDPNSNRYTSRHICWTHSRNGAPDSFTRNGFSYSHLPWTNTECRRMVQQWVPDGVEGEWKPARKQLLPPHIINKEQIEDCKWTCKPAYIGKWGVGADRRPFKDGRLRRSVSDSNLPTAPSTRGLAPNDRRSRQLVRELESWERQKLKH